MFTPHYSTALRGWKVLQKIHLLFLWFWFINKGKQAEKEFRRHQFYGYPFHPQPGSKKPRCRARTATARRRRLRRDRLRPLPRHVAHQLPARHCDRKDRRPFKPRHARDPLDRAGLAAVFADARHALRHDGLPHRRAAHGARTGDRACHADGKASACSDLCCA